MITVVGCDGRPLPSTALDRLRAATLVVGGARQMSIMDDLCAEAERVVLGEACEPIVGLRGDLAASTSRLVAHCGPSVVLASGDPCFFGVVRALRRAGLRPEIFPAVSSVALAFARLGLPWEDAVVVSAHGSVGERGLRRAVNACRAYPKVAVLTGPGAGAAELAAALPGHRLVVASRLGSPDERVGEYDGGPWPEPTVVVALGDGDDDPRWVAGPQPPPGGWALPEAAFSHRDSMVTKAEVRALVLARLGPRLGDLVWDVGAGSGSVSIECARLGAAVIAVDRDRAACDLVRRNAVAFGVRVDVVAAAAPQALDGLPDPDAVFVGGGGAGVLAACASRRPSRLVAAYATIEGVGQAITALRGCRYRVEGSHLNASRLVQLPAGDHRLAATNPVTVLWAEPE
jgi:precorrin-6B C5,15-methyltransferase / cobalt-precorrin-6B C5,C15-methyltransferase